MNEINALLNFLRKNFFYDFRSTVLTFCVIFIAVLLHKICNDDGKSNAKSFKYLVLTTMFFSTFLIIY